MKKISTGEMDEDIRLELMQGIISGDITAGHSEHKSSYTHAGLDNPDIEALNEQLQEAGERLLEGYETGKEKYQEAQEEIV